MAVNYKKIVSLSAFFGAVIFEGLRIVKDGFRGLERDRQKRKEQKIRDEEWVKRNAQKEHEEYKRKDHFRRMEAFL
jgi:hypothetical protein